MSGVGEENHYATWSMHSYWNDSAWGAREIYWEDNMQQDKGLLQSSIKYLSWVIKPGWKFLKDSRVQHTPSVFDHLHLTVLFNACNT